MRGIGVSSSGLLVYGIQSAAKLSKLSRIQSSVENLQQPVSPNAQCQAAVKSAQLTTKQLQTQRFLASNTMQSIFTSKRRQSLFPANFNVTTEHQSNCCMLALDKYCMLPCRKSVCPHPTYSHKIFHDRKIYQYLYLHGWVGTRLDRQVSL